MVVSPTKRRILERATELASTDGLEALTIGRLADDLGMSKAGLYGHFGSKERLQLETIEFGVAIFREHVTIPASEHPPGLARLTALCHNYLDYVERGVFPGGDFFVTVAHEYDSKRGPVRDEIAEAIDGWIDLLAVHIAKSVSLGELIECDAAQVAFEIEALLVAGCHLYRLQNDPEALARARTGISERLARLRRPPTPSSRTKRPSVLASTGDAGSG